MKVFELIPPLQSRCIFSYSHYKEPPDASGCYAITNYEKDVLYIGQSKHLRIRFSQHLSDPHKTQNLGNGKPTFFYYLLLPEKELDKLERTWIQQYELIHGHLPLSNKVLPPIR